MKKLMTVLLVVALVLGLSSVAMAAAFSDTADLSKDAQSSIVKLNVLNIINGYPDGTFKPGNTITRAEFAKIACITGGMGTSAEMLSSSPSKFSDVAAGQWYTGYVNLANSQGWVKGFPDGTFRPNAQISYAEVVTVLVRLLGYNDNLPGPWPVDYIAKAGQIDVTKNISFNANNPANRGDVALMTDNTLDATVVKWDNDTEDFEKQYVKKSSDKELTLMADKFNSAVNEDYRVEQTKYDGKVWSIKLKATDEDETAIDKKWVELSKDCVIDGGKLPTALDGNIVDVIYNDDDEIALFIEVTSSKVTVDGEDWEVTKTDKNGYPTQYKIDGTKYDVADWADTADLLKEGQFGDNDFVRAWITSDKDVYKVGKRGTKTPAIVESYDSSDKKLSVKVAGNYGVWDEIEDIDFGDDDVLIEKGGKFVEPTELKENDIIYVDDDESGYDYYDYYIDCWGAIEAEGELQAFQAGSVGDPDQIKIGGTWYDVALDTYLSTDGGDEFDDVINDDDLDGSYDDTIKYFLNKANQVCIAITEANGTASSTIYGAVSDLSFKTALVKGVTKNKINEIEVMKADGKTATYAVDTSEVELYGDQLTLDSFVKFTVDENNKIDNLTILAYHKTDAKGIQDPWDYYKGLNGETADADLKDYVNTKNSQYYGTVQDGDDDTDKIKFNGSWYKLTKDTVIFNGDAGDDDEIQTESVGDLVDWAAAAGKNQKAYVQFSGTSVEYIFVYGDVSSSSSADYAAVLKSYVKSGDNWVDVDVKGTKSSYKVTGTVPVKGYIYDYTITSNKFKVKKVGFDPADPTELKTTLMLDNDGSVTGDVYYVVQDVNKSNNAVKIADTWIYADEDTILYNYSDWYKSKDDPKYYSSVSFISKGDYVVVIGDPKEADLIIKANNINK